MLRTDVSDIVCTAGGDLLVGDVAELHAQRVVACFCKSVCLCLD